MQQGQITLGRMRTLSVFPIKAMKKFLALTILTLLLTSCASDPLPSQEPLAVEDESSLPEAFTQDELQEAPSTIFTKDDQPVNGAPDEEGNTVLEAFSPSNGSTDDDTPNILAIPNQDSICYYGCSEALFDRADTLIANALYYPIGVDSSGEWINILGPKYGYSCWLPISALSLQKEGQSVQLSDLSATSLITISCPAEPALIAQATSQPPPTTEVNEETGEATPTQAAETEEPDSEEKTSLVPEWDGIVASQPGRFARLMHDPQWMEWPSRIADPDWPNGFYFDWYPETVQLWLAPKSGDGRLLYSVAWLEYLRDLQPNHSAAVWIARVAAGLFNKGNEFIPILNLDDLEELPTAEGISSGGNVVNVLESRSGSYRIEMIYNQYSPPDPALINYYTTPWLVTKFTAVSIDGQLGNTGGIDVYFPNLAKQPEGYWVDSKRVELFPQLPYTATIRTPLNIRAEPSTQTEIIGELSSGDVVTFRQYLPQASNVWARIDAGWILIEYQNGSGVPVYTTSWSMETRPPILIP